MEFVIYNSEDEESQYTFADEMDNLNIPMEGRLVVIADLGLWNGRKNGYKIASENYPNICQILLQAQGDYYKVFYDNEDGEVKATDIHHDGTNRYIFRELRTDVDTDGLWKMLMDGGFTKEDLDKYTISLGERVKKVYGW